MSLIRQSFSVIRVARGLLIVSAIVALLAGCASTAPVETEAQRIAEEMRAQGLQLANLRAVPPPSSRAKAILENQGFDIPGINLQNEAAGTIRVYRDENAAKSDKQVFAMLGKPGPQSKLDYVTIEGTHGLFLDHRLPPEVADRYIKAFTTNQ